MTRTEAKALAQRITQEMPAAYAEIKEIKHQGKMCFAVIAIYPPKKLRIRMTTRDDWKSIQQAWREL